MNNLKISWIYCRRTLPILFLSRSLRFSLLYAIAIYQFCFVVVYFSPFFCSAFLFFPLHFPFHLKSLEFFSSFVHTKRKRNTERSIHDVYYKHIDVKLARVNMRNVFAGNFILLLGGVRGYRFLLLLLLWLGHFPLHCIALPSIYVCLCAFLC